MYFLMYTLIFSVATRKFGDLSNFNLMHLPLADPKCSAVQRIVKDTIAMFAVTVTFSVKPGQRDAFMQAILANAAASRETESGCHQFDVCTDADRPDEVFLYELYEDSAAFDAHLQTGHFATFAELEDDLIVDKTIKTYRTVA
ncbi:MAG: putative quinol monooxygenase [Pseudomonadota bacterium]